MPQVIDANAFNCDKGGLVFIDEASLHATPSDGKALSYTISIAPNKGALLIDGLPAVYPIVLNDVDIASKRLWYAHDGAEVLLGDIDEIGFTVSNGIDPSVEDILTVSLSDNAGWLLLLEPFGYAAFVGGWYSLETVARMNQFLWEALHAGNAYRVSLPVGSDFSLITELDDDAILDRVLPHPVGRIDGGEAQIIATRLMRSLEDNPNLLEYIETYGPDSETNLYTLDSLDVSIYTRLRDALDRSPKRAVKSIVHDWIGVLAIVQRQLKGIY